MYGGGGCVLLGIVALFLSSTPRSNATLAFGAFALAFGMACLVLGVAGLFRLRSEPNEK